MTTYLGATLILIIAFSSASGQAGENAKGETNQSLTRTSDGVADKNEGPKSAFHQDNASIWIHLVGGRRTQVDDVTEVADGVWYKQGNVTTFIDRARFERIERSVDPRLSSLSETFEGTGKWSISDSARVESFFVSRFNRPLPLTAFGQSDLHNRWGLDHRHSMDVGLHPDSLEGKALIRFLLSEGIPFLAFRGSVPGVATGPHIHIGHGSPRLPARK
jgi:hypothetical protein